MANCFRGHTEAVICLQYKKDRLVSGSHDKTIKVTSLLHPNH